MSNVDERRSIIDYMSNQLVGPFGGSAEVLSEKPHKRYLMGILFPTEAVEDDVDDDTPDEVDNSVSLSSEFKPSAMALSFAVSGDAEISIDLQAGTYARDGKCWRRSSHLEVVKFRPREQDSYVQSVLDGNAQLKIVKRPWEGGWILTVALSNNIKCGVILDAAKCLYQTGIECKTTAGSFTEYPTSDRFRFDEEQQELALLYRKRVNWGVGHGCACVWEKEGSIPTWLKSASIPEAEVYGFSTTIDFNEYGGVPDEVLRLQWLADENTPVEELVGGLKQFIRAYHQWIEEQRKECVPDKFLSTKENVIARLDEAERRMHRGVAALKGNALKSFRLANQAMLMQMVHGRDDFSGKVKIRNQEVLGNPDYFSSQYEGLRWYPFQLAFQLLVMESLVYTDLGDYSESRDLVDLLWFPTGGGKTEAYLSLAAWELVYRRLEDGLKGAGTTVIKRYTLRLLTSQQFQRAGTMICALELIRQENEDLLGKMPFSLGLWVGQASAPNRFSSGNSDNPAALELFNFMMDEDEPENPFQLKHCPWCGTSITPETRSSDQYDYGVRATETKFEFYCPTDSCAFHDELPIQVVDEALYKKPPSMLIGTIDKFARMAWRDDTQAFFGFNGKYNPPSLIIQDELHLISGPLGTIAGIYEAGIDSLIKKLGGRVKIIAATATIRAAQQQSRRLFGRDMQIFPPPGLDAADSFYSRENTDAPGRMYLGVMPSGHTGQTALVQTAAALLQSPVETKQAGGCLDTWWTLPIYHNSRRELGKTMTLARDDIPSRIEVIAADRSKARKCEEVEELSANVKGPRIPEVLQKLKLKVGESGAVDILPCTNMISVGVDIGRLGVMLVNGQPKTTAEYIQASSRVGRDKKRPPAIILTMFSPSKPRDRSHYETFSTYHQSLYRYVEPTSITPWAPPARERALHAALIVLVRLSGHLTSNDTAGKFDKNDPDFKSLYVTFKERISESTFDMDAKEVQKILIHLDEIIDEWHGYALNNEINRYESAQSGHQFNPLIKPFDGGAKKQGFWKTLNSMRNVDTETQIKVRGEA
jgi:hypothetical protein